MSNDEKWIKVACRLCGKIMLFPKGVYQEKDLIGWECRGLCQEDARSLMKGEEDE